MKNVIQKVGIVLGVTLLAFTACKKEDIRTVSDAVNDDNDIVALVTQADNDLNADLVSDDSPETGIDLTGEAVSSDYLVIAEDIEEAEGPAGNDDKMRSYARSHSFVACLRKLELTDRQKAAVKKSMMEYQDCKESAVKRARAIYAKLRAQYQAKFERLMTAFKNGDITREEFKTAVHRLRMSFHKELRSMHLAEKLDAAFKNCFRSFLGDLKNILNERQWKAFVACHKR